MPRTSSLLLACLALACAGGRDDAELARVIAIARAELDAGDARAALETLGRAVLLAPDSAEAWRLRAHAFACLDEPEPGLAALDRALALDPNDVWTHYARGVALKRLGRPLEAIASFDRALALDRTHAKAWVHRAHARLEAGDGAGARADLLAARRFVPEGSEDREWLERTLAGLGGDSPTR
ncbi:MAG: tetratricopeptide repeat protein [Planctomycetes bacterium]|nr:tetratricopeptide repeat protein [Planctomycetota bacterium]